MCILYRTSVCQLHQRVLLYAVHISCQKLDWQQRSSRWLGICDKTCRKVFQRRCGSELSFRYWLVIVRSVLRRFLISKGEELMHRDQNDQNADQEIQRQVMAKEHRLQCTARECQTSANKHTDIVAVKSVASADEYFFKIVSAN